MPWTRLDDGFIAHPKILTLSHPAFRLHVSGLNWSVANEQDGRVPEVVLALALPLDRPKQRLRAVTELEEADLWIRNGTGWLIHDFADYQETKAEVQERRRRWAEQKRERRNNVRADSNPDSAMDSPAESGVPSSHVRGGSHPIPSQREPEHAHPEGLTTPRDALRAWAKITNQKPTDTWLNNRKRLHAAQNFLEQHAHLTEDELERFLAFAVIHGCATPQGWADWWPTWPGNVQKIGQKPDCETCGNTRIAWQDHDGNHASPDHDGAVAVWCPACSGEA